MTLKQVIDRVDAIKPNAFDEATKTMWINEVEGFVQTEVFLLAVEDVIEYVWPTDQNTELLVPAPHSKLYWTYLTAMVDFANGEYDKYNNTMQVYNAFMSEYMRWYAAHYRPADGKCIEHGYYISAYGIAVKHGYVGTEEEWIASLKGNQGDKGDPGEGITYVEYNTDGTMTVYYGDGESATSPNLKGEQGETGEQGPKGASGVYVGAEEPTDPDIDVWIEPQGVADRFVKTVNGVAPDENGNVQLPVYDGSVSE